MASRENGITRFGLRNFKAFRYLEDIELKPLTLLVGANSSGKSSIFQSLLLLKQTLLSSAGTGALKFDGDWVKLSGFSSVISDFDVSKELEYRFILKTSFFEDASGLMQVPNGWASRPFEGALRFSVGMSNPAAPATLASLVFNLTDDRSGSQHSSLRVDRTGAVFGSQELMFSERHEQGISGHFLPSMTWFDLPRERSHLVEFVAKFMYCEKAANSIHDDLVTKLDYLGPVRADPRPFYPISEEPDIGVRGEGAIPYLLKQRANPVTFAPGPTGDLQQASLFDALNHWLRHMRVAPGLSIETVESIAYTAAVHTPLVKGRPVNLAQVGFGVSQLLPVLLQGLRNPTDAWILFEQPEIHLHPRLQAELGDFFLASARTGKTLMVETHSDHMVHRIRRRIAEDTTGELADLVQILFVHAGTEENPGSYVEPLRVAPDGSIENWPDDFLSESADEALAILRARRARAK